MSTGQGAASRAALGKETVWGTRVAVDTLIPFDSESVVKSIAQIESAYLDGTAGKRSLIGSLIDAMGDLSGEMVFDQISGGFIGIEDIVRGAFGAGAWDAANTLSQYTLNSTIDDSYTVAFNKQVSAWEIGGVKIGSLALSGAAGEICKFSASLIGQDLLRTGDAGIVNAIAAITGISPSNTPVPITFNDLVFRIGDQANALAGGDQLGISQFEFGLNNSLSDPTFSTIDSTNTNAKTTLEPERNGLREVTIKITVPRYIADTMFSNNNNDTPLQADLIWTNGSDSFSLFLPNIYVTSVSAPISGPEIISQEIEFTAVRNNGTNTYMTLTDSTAITEEAAIEVASNRSVNV